MSQHRAGAPLSVEIPPGGADQPSWSKVGVIAAVGFMVGVAWPRLAGVRLGPSLPADAVASASASAPAAEAPLAAVVPAPSTSTPTQTATASAPSTATSVSVGHGAIFSCKSRDGDSFKGADCGTLPGLDGLVMPRLRKLADCPQAAGVTGKLHLVVHVDFGRESVGVEAGKNSSLAATDNLVACAKAAVADVHLGGIAHDNQRYGVAYAVTFAEGTASAAPAAAAAAAQPAPAGQVAAPAHDANDAVQVAWDVAIVRDVPRTGKIVARLEHGTSVRVGPPKEGWYPVKYGDGFSSEGWVYRAAIGK
jgi:hypothetical protein